MLKYKSLAYFGGKEGEVGDWIASMLPYRHAYVETHGGMAKILLKRVPSKVELINDLDLRIILFWRVLRERKDELVHLVRHTPHSREEFYEARQRIREVDWSTRDDLLRAWDIYVVLQQSFQHSLRLHRTGWRRSFTTDPRTPSHMADRLDHLVKRIEHVQLENIDALELLERTKDVDDITIYVDPPYYGVARYDTHLDDPTDRGDLVRMLQSQKGIVAVSGYGTEWDDLGWIRRAFRTKTAMVKNPELKNREEILWLNCDPKGENLTLL